MTTQMKIWGTFRNVPLSPIDTQDECWEVAYKIGLDALDRCAEEIEQTPNNLRDALAALLTVVSHAAYAMAPSEKIAEGMISFAQEMAQDNWAAEKHKNQKGE